MRHEKSNKTLENSGGLCRLVISTDQTNSLSLPDFVQFLLLPSRYNHPPAELELHVTTASSQRHTTLSPWATHAPGHRGTPLLVPSPGVQLLSCAR